MQWRVGEDSNHMYSFDISNSMTSTNSSASSRAGYGVSYATDYNLDSSRGPSPPPPPRRRSHRPRGCRGGRKNRKNKQQTDALGNFPTNGPQGPFSSATFGNGNIGILPDAPLSQRQNQDFPQLSKGNLSAYQHSRTETSTMNWSSSKQSISLIGNFESVRCSNNHISPHKITNHTNHYKSISSPSPKKPTLQVLPPALPPFVVGKDPFLQGEESLDMGLKMLPSFEDSVVSESFNSSPVSKHSSSPTKQLSESSSSHFACGNSPNNNNTHSHSSTHSEQAAAAVGSSSSYFASTAQRHSLWLDNLLGLSSDNSYGSSSCISNSIRIFSKSEDCRITGGYPMMDSSVISLSSTNSSSCGEEDDRDIHEILFGTEALGGISLFDTSPRSFLTRGESKAPVW